MLWVDVAIPTYKPGEKFSRLLKMFSVQAYPIGEIIVMSTEKAYWNEEGFERISNLEVHHLSREEFDHRATRSRGARYSKTGIMVFATGNAVPADEKLVESLTAAFGKRGIDRESIIMAYARQLPDRDCTMAERFTRSFNYPGDSYIKAEENLGGVDIKTFFAPNVCCTYNREEFWFQGGFAHRTIFNGDMIFAGKAVLQDDYIIAHVVEARVIHSYNYGCATQFRRSFNLAVSQTDHLKVFEGIRPEGEGIRLVRQIARYLVAHHRPWPVPGLIVKSGSRYTGCRLGRYHRFLPVELTAACSMNKEYWK